MPKVLNNACESRKNNNLPEGWECATDYDGKVYFIDHNNKTTTWIHPGDRYTTNFQR